MLPQLCQHWSEEPKKKLTNQYFSTQRCARSECRFWSVPKTKSFNTLFARVATLQPALANGSEFFSIISSVSTEVLLTNVLTYFYLIFIASLFYAHSLTFRIQSSRVYIVGYVKPVYFRARASDFNNPFNLIC